MRVDVSFFSLIFGAPILVRLKRAGVVEMIGARNEYRQYSFLLFNCKLGFGFGVDK